jgi:hypothetical protein
LNSVKVEPGDQEEDLAFVRYYDAVYDNTLKSYKLVWAKQQGEPQYGVVRIASILSPVFLVPEMIGWGTNTSQDTWYVVPYMR